MKSTRQQIIDHLRIRRIASAPELAQALGVTAANVRHHLSILLEEGAVLFAGQRRKTGRGRPTSLYALARRSQEHNLDGLASALLQVLDTLHSQDARPLALHKVATLIVGGKQPPEGSLTQRLYACIKHLNSLNYRARWEAHSTGPQLVLENCPYAAVIAKHPELCQMDKYLLEELLNAQLEQTARLVQTRAGTTYCEFAILP